MAFDPLFDNNFKSSTEDGVTKLSWRVKNKIDPIVPTIEICRICGCKIAPNRHDILYHHRLDMNTDKRSIEPVHAACNYFIEDALDHKEVPEGHVRYEAAVVNPSMVRIKISTRKVFLHGENFVKSIMIVRQASCLYFKNMLQVDVPNDILEMLEVIETVDEILTGRRKTD